MNLKILFIENIPWLQKVDDYRLVDSRRMTQVMNTTDWKKKITRENFFWTLKFFLLLKLSSQLCLMKIVEALFIGEDSDLKFYWIFNLEKFWNLSRVEIAGAMKSAEGEYFFFSLLETWKEKISFYFPILHVACKVVESRQIILFTTYS